VNTRLALVATFALLLLGLPAAGAVFVANIANDRTDAVPGDGICDVDDSTEFRECTLRAAVQTANETPAGDVITLGAATYTLTISGAGEDAAATGDLDITTPMEIASDLITGSYNTTLIDGKKLKDRIFDVRAGGSLDLRRTSLLEAKAPKNESGGCVRAVANLTFGNVFMFRCASATSGGCVSQLEGAGDFSNSVFSTCKAKTEGGGLEVAAAASATLLRVTFGANRGGTGGGIAARGDLVLRNVTVDGNGAKVGGGVALLGDGVTTMSSTTISENGKVNLDASATTGAVTLSNTIVWGATTDCLGGIVSAGGNLEGETSCGFSGTNDQQSQDPRLAVLDFHGGFVPTRPPTRQQDDDLDVQLPNEFTSPAIDHGVDGATCVSPDARQLNRTGKDVPEVDVASCDSGAVEYNFIPPPAP
jgi:hypothetical protein